ncbi:unnamed protein product [Ilex paraguariensis]|uniref:Uncharacterized protein n=1 Tax=Ilex paraguariensis TaxID=185542 RepID=A0ABC8RN25_9AQUA
MLSGSVEGEESFSPRDKDLHSKEVQEEELHLTLVQIGEDLPKRLVKSRMTNSWAQVLMEQYGFPNSTVMAPDQELVRKTLSERKRKRKRLPKKADLPDPKRLEVVVHLHSGDTLAPHHEKFQPSK